MQTTKKQPMSIGEAAKEIGVSKRTLYNWLYAGKISEVDRDRNNHRVFDEKDIKTILAYANKRVAAPHKRQKKLFKDKENVF